MGGTDVSIHLAWPELHAIEVGEFLVLRNVDRVKCGSQQGKKHVPVEDANRPEPDNRTKAAVIGVWRVAGERGFRDGPLVGGGQVKGAKKGQANGHESRR
ncbi:hypothetical protein K456DRAFT_51967 [Colletotrichum gloeosporioides 23]|nr:hypothetical protein K456DRAFT_51967 [Colletotrichum gloeosporioides 23]